jgi:hypothetical protein
MNFHDDDYGMDQQVATSLNRPFSTLTSGRNKLERFS